MQPHRFKGGCPVAWAWGKSQEQAMMPEWKPGKSANKCDTW